DKLTQLLQIQNIREICQRKKYKMLDDKIDVTRFWTWLINNYPNSINDLKEQPDFQDTFKSVYNNSIGNEI
ncbi:MAG: hypothetical protein Q8T08_13410, partial [Ignavibacteria bacterium]|nr:hypothetical protein [Ignavibacteria bacterium]